jgi:exodeoxyribonuclease III
MTRIYSWNVNGIRAAQKKGLGEWLQSTAPDILALQETKAQPDQLDAELTDPEGYSAVWASAEKKGYSGVCVYSKREPLKVDPLEAAEFDSEGRGLILTFPEFTLFNCYFPNSQSEGARLEYKLAFCSHLIDQARKRVAAGEQVVIVGDYNIAHKPIDLARPKQNEQNPGYLPEERAWMDTFTSGGFSDSFRLFTSEGGHYSWWSYRAGARQKNIGWRIDYACVNDAFRDSVAGASIHPTVMGSDHCPVSIELNL